MHIEEIEATGLCGFLGTRRLGRFERLLLPWEERRALRDALRLPFALFDAALLGRLLDDWGALEVEVTEDGFGRSVRFVGAPGLESLVAPGSGGLVRVRVRIRLDPPQFATLRQEAVRDTRLVDALAGGPTCELAVGVLFGPGTLSFDLRSFQVGGAPFAVTGPDRPSWLPAFLTGLRGRLAADPAGAPEWGLAARSWSPERQDRVAAATAALARSPASVSGVHPLPEEPGLRLGERLLPLRFAAPEVRSAFGWVGTVHLHRPDVVVAAGSTAASTWEAWWAAELDAAEAAIEQVILLGEPADA